MRTLIYVPVIHTRADLGSLADNVIKRGIADLGEDFWKGHEKTVEGFWEAIIKYFKSFETAEFKIYQDGMVAEGEMGQKIVEEGVKSGSKNYEIISSLLQKGAILIRTEEFNLVKEERDRLSAITQAKSSARKITAVIKYKLIKNRLLGKRDGFIAKRINETLKDGETGVVFIGAYHNIKKYLHNDIQIKEIKDADRVKEYQMLLPFYNRDEDRFRELSRYLVCDVNTGEIEGGET